MQDYSFNVPIFGGYQSITMNAMDVIYSHHCHACRCPLSGAVVALGTPICALVHSQCLAMVNYSAGWQHQYPVSTYKEAALAGLSHNLRPLQIKRGNE